jgi:hypothetical protein
MSSFTVRPYEPGDEEGLLALFNRVFSEGNPAFVPRTMEAWRAIYLDNPAGMQTFVGLDADGAVVANYSSIPAAAVVRGERRLCTQAVDSCVDRAWRGSLRKQSLFVTIATEFIRHFSTEGQEPFDDFMYGLPNEQAFPVGTRIIGYKPVHVPLHALVHDVTPATPAWVGALDAEGAAAGVRVEEFAGAEVGEAAALFERHLAQVPLAIWRDAPYLSWRYRPRPDCQYRALLARRGGELCALVVFRMGWMGQPLVPLVDWIGPGAGRPALAALLGHVARLGAEAGARRRVTWITPQTAHHATLAALGLASEPTRFNLCIMTFGPRVELEWAKAHWFLTMGDTDIF